MNLGKYEAVEQKKTLLTLKKYQRCSASSIFNEMLPSQKWDAIYSIVDLVVVYICINRFHRVEVI